MAKARERVLAERRVQQQWEDKAAESEQALVELRDGVGEVALDRPEEARTVARRLAELDAEIEVAGRALFAQAPRVRAAEVAYLESEAAVLQSEVDRCREVLRAHEARTEELLAPLREHEGDFVPAHELARARHDSGPRSPGASWVLPKSHALRMNAELAERPLMVLQELIAGRDPSPLLLGWRTTAAEVYPPCVFGSDALVPANAYLEELGRAREIVAELERLPAEIQDDIENLHRRAAREMLPADIVELGVRRREARLAEVPAQLEAARAQLAALEPVR